MSVEEGKALAREMKAIFLETSAKENQVSIDILNSLYFDENAGGNIPLDIAIDIGTYDSNSPHVTEKIDNSRVSINYKHIALIIWEKCFNLINQKK